jgi:hypothetical protein
MIRKRCQGLLRRFAVIVERDGVEIARDIIHAMDAYKAKARFLGLTVARQFDFSDRAVVCRVQKSNGSKGRLHLPPADNWFK